MKKIANFVVILLCAVLLGACGASGENGKRVNSNGTSVEDVLKSRTENPDSAEEKKNVESTGKTETNEVDKNTEASQNPVLSENAISEQKRGVEYTSIDMNIAAMGSDMVYATVYQLMVNPEEYLGKVIRIKGIHNSSYYPPTDLTYHYAIISDATACCAQGIEFEMAAGLDYPPENVEVVVTGVFDVYEEEGYLYCTLRNSLID